MQLIMKRLGPLPPTDTAHTARLERIDGLDDDLELEHGPCLRFVYRFEEPHQRRQAAALTSTTLNEHSQLYSLVTGMLGRELEDGEDVTDALRELVGQLFRVTIEHREGRGRNTVFLDVVAAEPAPN